MQRENYIPIGTEIVIEKQLVLVYNLFIEMIIKHSAAS